ncbi:family 10 glycosylhydrolase [Romboutsia lituseburensis]|uniref:family 10 glycosylhydrolase n=1 Tax=Romboutsia lituseburensis TaxID=1537 RepID=UPI00215AACF7|nr:family 10 glycosylhydrolase [Romboutsia lituseburensis]MCR8745440.1 family 10 glycosylhydrolase [Romboutsia lituseburensis]
MKKILAFLMVFCMIAVGGISSNIYANSTDMQAAWITTVFNADWPKAKNSPQSQKQEMIKILDTLKSTGIDTVMFQARTEGDALYKSSINPWSKVLTGTQGKDPGYDPLEFVLQEAHKRGMKVHVWLNPYRASTTSTGTDVNKLSPNHQARKNPSWVINYNNMLYFNPELPQVKQHIVDTVAEIVSNYDVDGVHFDDYFYPSKYPLPAGEGRDGKVANERRSHINDMISQVKSKVKSIKPSVLFGVSPSGIWKNKSSDSNGSDTRGNESYYSDYADTRMWVKNNMVDYIVPQIYWQTGHSAADYETLVKWWSNVAKGTNVKLYIGHGIYKDEVATQIDKQLQINTKYNEVSGSVYYTTIDILNNREGCRDKIKTFLSNNPPSDNTSIIDIKNHWAYEAIASFIEKGYVGGYEDNTFRPDNSITRAEFVKILNGVFNITNSSEKVFIDTADHWAKHDIDIAVTNGVCSGKTETEFKPDDLITREEAATMIANYKKIADANLDKLSKYNDAGEVSDWAKPSVEGSIEKGYVGGYSDNTIKPKNNITRAEAVVILSRVN